MAAKKNKFPFEQSRELLVLTILGDGEKSGYEIIKRLTEYGDKAFAEEEGFVYVTLHMLESCGDVTSVERGRGKEGRRRYYRLTKQGTHAREEKQRAYLRAKSTHVAGGGTCVRKE